MKLTKAKLKQIIREETNNLVERENLDELFGFGSKPGYQQDIESEEEAASLGYESDPSDYSDPHTATQKMFKSRDMFKLIKSCPAFVDLWKFAANKFGAKVPTNWFGALDLKRIEADAAEQRRSAAQGIESSDIDYFAAFTSFEKAHPDAYAKAMVEVKANCPDLGSEFM